ncbi:MAG: hypothetical protein LBC47_07355 [Tannerella sp.]|jgi:hypothetical protein|nr:hypothetical protein [Tannerella sp.]
MDKVRHILLVILIIAFTGCTDDNFRTLHPDEGGIILTTEWVNNENAAISTYRARAVSPSGFIREFDNLSGTTNNLVVEPGDVTLFVYNDAEHIQISNDRATVTSAGNTTGGIAANPGQFFSSCGKVRTEQDQDTPHTALMIRRTGSLKLSFAIKPVAMISRVKAIRASLEGVAAEVNLQTGVLSNSSTVYFSLSQNGFYATAMISLLGFETSARQNLNLNVEFEDGNTVNVTNDISSLVKGFDASKNSLFTLNAMMSVSADGDAPTVTVGNWEWNTESRYLAVSVPEVNLPDESSGDAIIVTTDQISWVYSVIKTGDWLTIDKTDTQLNISVSDNMDSNPRRATINISAGGLSESVTVIQNGYVPKLYSDRDVVKLQSATVGQGVNLVMLGDGYTSEDMVKGTGKYERDMRAATEYFLSVYPYTVYREYFNVYMVVAVSNEEGISVESPYKKVDTKFEATWEGYGSTGISSNTWTVIEYLDEISDLETADLNDITVIMPINAYIYAGTCMMGYAGNSVTDFGNGFSISMCPAGSNFKEVVVHEAGGHGFAKLMDEYVYFRNETIPDEEKDEYLYFKNTYGWCENIDFYGDILQTSWSGFANNPKYSMVGTFEGACLYGKGVWRPEQNSCMNDNVLYFNAPSRWAQVRRLKKLAGLDYSFAQFIEDDVVPEYPAAVRSGRSDKEFIPLASPVIMDIKDIRRKK